MSYLLMNKLFVCLILFTASCKNDDVKYYTHDNWQIPGGYNYYSLRDKPKEVKESLYLDLSDTSLNANGRFNNYDLWKFDEEGNIIYRKEYLDDSFWIVHENTYNENGIQTRIYSDKDTFNTRENLGKKTSELLANNKFLEKSFFIDSKPDYKLVSFQNNGEIEKIEEIQDTTDLNKIASTHYQYYKNNLLQKIEMIVEGHSKIQSYYYSKENFLDSIVMSVDGKNMTKEIYYNNKYGDPIKYFEIEQGNDTTMVATLQYEYDEHGNWIKQLEKSEDRNKYTLMLGDLKPKYSLLVREIKY